MVLTSIEGVDQCGVLGGRLGGLLLWFGHFRVALCEFQAEGLGQVGIKSDSL